MRKMDVDKISKRTKINNVTIYFTETNSQSKILKVIMTSLDPR